MSGCEDMPRPSRRADALVDAGSPCCLSDFARTPRDGRRDWRVAYSPHLAPRPRSFASALQTRS